MATTIDDVLIPDDELGPHLDEVRRRAPTLNPPVNLDLRAPWGGALARYLLLRHAPDLVANQSITDLQRFYSRYYWFKRFAVAYIAENGPDAGIEQQLLQALEYPPDEVSLALVEAVDTRAASDAARSP